MLDTMTATKIVGGFCSMLLVFLLGGWAAGALYGSYGHDDHGEQAYTIDTGEDDAVAEEDAEPEVPFEEVFAAADASAGEGLWRPCAACHKVEDGANGVGPHLWGVVGRDKGSVDGFDYSEAMATQEGDWTPENLNAFLENPKGYTPGTKMNYNGMRDIEDRANLIAWLESQGS